DAVDTRRVPGQALRCKGLFGPPQQQPALGVAADEEFAIRRPAEGRERRRVAAQRGEKRTGVGVPDYDAAIEAAARESPPVRPRRECEDGAVVSNYGSYLCSRA